MDETQKEITISVTSYTKFHFKVSSFGLINIPSTFQRTMIGILREKQFGNAFLDDVVVFYNILAERTEHSESIFHITG